MSKITDAFEKYASAREQLLQRRREFTEVKEKLDVIVAEHEAEMKRLGEEFEAQRLALEKTQEEQWNTMIQRFETDARKLTEQYKSGEGRIRSACTTLRNTAEEIGPLLHSDVAGILGRDDDPVDPSLVPSPIPA